MLFIFNLHTFFFSSLHVWSQTNEQKMNVIRRHEQTNRKNDKKFNGFLYFFVCCSWFFLYRLCSAHTFGSFFFSPSKTFSWKCQTYEKLNFAEAREVSEVINWRICFVFPSSSSFPSAFVCEAIFCNQTCLLKYMEIKSWLCE